MRIKTVEIEHKTDGQIGAVQTNIQEVQRIEIRTGKGESFILTPAGGELIITKQCKEDREITLRLVNSNCMRISYTESSFR